MPRIDGNVQNFWINSTFVSVLKVLKRISYRIDFSMNPSSIRLKSTDRSILFENYSVSNDFFESKFLQTQIYT